MRMSFECPDWTSNGVQDSGPHNPIVYVVTTCVLQTIQQENEQILLYI